VALMLVLWVIVLLGAVGLGIVSASRSQTDLARTFRASVVARYAAESGIEFARSRFEGQLLASVEDPAAGDPFHRLASELETTGTQSIGEARFQVAAVDPASRIDLNRSSDPLTLGLLEPLFGERRAASLLATLRDWTDEDDAPREGGAEAAEYAAAGSPYRPPNRPLRSLDDLPRIRGFTDSISLALAPFVTVWGDGRVNVNTAPREVLAAVPALGPDGADAVIAARGADSGIGSKVGLMGALTQRLERPIGAQLGSVTTSADRVLFVSRGWEEGSPLSHEIRAVFEVVRAGAALGSGTPRLELRHWEERLR
jgi:type II secretory pathway component PulK